MKKVLIVGLMFLMPCVGDALTMIVWLYHWIKILEEPVMDPMHLKSCGGLIFHMVASMEKLLVCQKPKVVNPVMVRVHTQMTRVKCYPRTRPWQVARVRMPMEMTGCIAGAK